VHDRADRVRAGVRGERPRGRGRVPRARAPRHATRARVLQARRDPALRRAQPALAGGQLGDDRGLLPRGLDERGYVVYVRPVHLLQHDLVAAEELRDRRDAEGRRDPELVEARPAVLSELVLGAEAGGECLSERVALAAVGAVAALAGDDVALD